MRRDDARLVDIYLAARKVQRFVAGMTYAEFRANELVQSAVVRELQVIGEAARALTDETRAMHPEINWRRVVGMRNRLVHEYFSISLEIVWKTVQTEVAPLVSQLEQYAPPDLGLLE
jgi:uncharacterized protein with HEPN domain